MDVDRLDLLVFGATGLTGKHSIAYIHKIAISKSLRWGVAGRSENKLKDLLKHKGNEFGCDFSHIPVVVADIADEESLLLMAKKTKVLLNCCGPFRTLGRPVVDACIRAGTHQVDVNGEPQYMEKLQLHRHTEAEDKGVYILSACGLDSIPCDLGIIQLQKEFKGVLNSVVTYFEDYQEGEHISGVLANYTTWASSITASSKWSELKELRKKLFLTELPDVKPKLRRRLLPHKTDLMNGWMVRMPGPDHSVVERTQRYFYETEAKRPIQVDCLYAERKLWVLLVLAFLYLVFSILCKFESGRKLLLHHPKIFSFGVFAKDQIPSQKKLDNTVFRLVLCGEGWIDYSNDKDIRYNKPCNGQIVAQIKGRSPWYGVTALCLVAAGLTVLTERENMPGRLENFLKKFKIVSEQQHGFRPGKSTNTAIQSFYSEILRVVEAGECPAGIFCDLSRAFDCVDHSKLLDKLCAYGLRGVSLDWLSSFLSNRVQYVSIKYKNQNRLESASSANTEVSVGVPQGSILGPTLFLLYITEIDTIFPRTHFTLYADDISLIISNKSNNILQNECESILESLMKWFWSNKLLFNPDKTSILKFQTVHHHNEDFKIELSGQQIVTSDTVKFLGIELDKNLSFKTHCESLTSKLNSLYYLIYNLKIILTREQLMCFYHAQVESRLRYGINFWGNSVHSKNTFIIQKRIVRCLAGKSRQHSCRDLFKNLNILTVTGLFIFEICSFVYRNGKGIPKNYNVHNINTRQKNDFRIPFARLNITSSSPNCIGPRLFNKLPESVKNCTTEIEFKKQIKSFLVDKAFYTVSEFLCAFM